MVIAFGRSNSVSKVVAVIRNFRNGISQKEIIAATGLSERSVKSALKELLRLKLATEAVLASDLRAKKYFGR